MFLTNAWCSILTTPVARTVITLKKPLPVLPPEVWLEILEFATYMHQSDHLAPLDPFISKCPSNNVMAPNTPLLAQRTKCALVLVSRSWNRISTPILYRHVVVLSPARATTLLHTLDSHPYGDITQGRLSEYGSFVKSLEIFTHARNANSIPFLRTLFRIFMSCPNLRLLSGNWNHSLPNDFVHGITRIYGPSLKELYWHDDKEQSFLTPEYLSAFQALRVLNLRNWSGRDITPATFNNRPTLPLVEHLILSTTNANLVAATALSLPSLQTLTLKAAEWATMALEDVLVDFLKLHGSTLASVHLPGSHIDTDCDPFSRPVFPISSRTKPEIFLRPGMCPNLHTLTFATNAPIIRLSTPHQSLRRIGLRDIHVNALYPDKTNSTKAHLMSFTRNNFPGLETVRTIGFLVDADTDILVEEVFIWWTEKFERDGIDFQDGAGMVWIYDDSNT